MNKVNGPFVGAWTAPLKLTSKEARVHLKLTSFVCLTALTGALSVGCASKPADPNTQMAGGSDPAVLDISPSPAPEPAPAPFAVDPAPVAAPAPVVTAPPATGGSSYTVQKGDTLWKIASNQYGDGKQWQRIASANPGLTPETLKIGQTIYIP